jgi:hypothetical protein
MDKTTTSQRLHNYEDSKCEWGYMTVCDNCKPNAPRHVNISREVMAFPAVECEMCKSKNGNCDRNWPGCVAKLPQ